MWYRLSKVIYIFFSILFALWVGTVIYEILPTTQYSQIIQPVQQNTQSEEIKQARYLLSLWLPPERIKRIILLARQKKQTQQDQNNKNSIIRYIETFISSFVITYVIFFQLINRVFYYIILWNFNPKKE